MLRYLLLPPVLLAACQSLPDTPTLDVEDRFRWADRPVIRAAGLEPGRPYTLELARVSAWSDSASERSSLTYTSDAKGRLDTSAQAADGDFEASPYVPIRTLSYKDEPLTDLAPGRLRIRLRADDDTLVAERVVGIGSDMSALVEDPLGDNFPGAFVLRRADSRDPSPAVVVLGGSEGGDGSARSAAPRFAEAGYTVLGLPYYSPAWSGEAEFPDLPQAFSELPIDYLESAVAALRSRPDVDADHVMLVGASKGAEYVLLAGSLIPDTSPGGGFCGIVANVPTDVVWEGWGDGPRKSSFSWQGEALPFVPYANIGAGIDPNNDYTLAQSHADGRDANPDAVAPARIRVESIDEPVLVTGGDKDTVWPSGPMARNIKTTRDAAGLETEAYVYTDGSHGVSGTPLRRGSRADTEARLENYPATMAFLARNAKRDGCRD